MSVKDIHIADYNYSLPDERIAKYPVAKRDESKLLVYRGGDIATKVFKQIPEVLESGTLLVCNNTKVIQARLRFEKETGGRVEIFCLDPHEPSDYQLAFSVTGRCVWHCMVGNLKKWKEGALKKDCIVAGKPVELKAVKLGGAGLNHTIEFSWNAPDVSFAEILDSLGELPIPPYLNRSTEERDKETYQTVYSKIKGSVAAPTAGLHFTDEVLADLNAKGVSRAEVTLHVGAGTFYPVKSEDIGGHDMHTEVIEVTLDTLKAIRGAIGNIVAVGTTSVRTLESLYYLGCRLIDGNEEMFVGQWEPYIEGRTEAE
ncbi:MAG: S-adenosylmethionine:tRNA ribosyltransferase-isomerase, partial [Paludibacteraceae bacterium]|nr:S-adenosylmethionine:tRNA ribosyltransferase-isomerase [Paludibacteraceae bacterium]